MANYHIGDLSRREILKMCVALASAGTLLSERLAWAQAVLGRTPGQVLGPFYPITDIWTKSGDLTRPRDGSGRAVRTAARASSWPRTGSGTC